MKEIFQRKLFWAMLVILLLAVFIYPPFMVLQIDLDYSRNHQVRVYREWAWIFKLPGYYEMLFGNPHPSLGELDLKMLLAESIIAVLLSIGVCLIPFSRGRKKKD